MKEQLKTRIIDLLIIICTCLIFWATYTGYVLTTSFKNLMDGQCQIIQKQALDQAVEKALADKETEK